MNRSIKSSLGKLSVNINGDSRVDWVQRAKLIEKAGLSTVWVGEFDQFLDPFEVAEKIAQETSLNVGFGVLTVKRPLEEIIKKLEELRKIFGERFVVGLGAGKYDTAKLAYMKVKKYAELLADDYPVFIGASSPKLADLSERFDGLLINAVKPEFVRWLKRRTFNASYGPSLLLPSDYEIDLVLASLLVFLGHKRLVLEFGLARTFRDLSCLNIDDLIKKRMLGLNLDEPKVKNYRDFLVENFAICGREDLFIEKLKNLLSYCDHVVLADPFFRDLKSLEFLEVLVCEVC
ncbi:MAG: hypothetical protein QXM06_05820 [Archaeoglobaceae archaeon]